MRQKYSIRVLLVGDEPKMRFLFDELVRSHEFVMRFTSEEKFVDAVYDDSYHVCVLQDSISERIIEIINEYKLNKCFSVYIFRQDRTYDRPVRLLIRDNQQVRGEIYDVTETPYHEIMRQSIMSENPLFGINLNLKMTLIRNDTQTDDFTEAAEALLEATSMKRCKKDAATLISQFEDLICRVFHDCSSVTMKPLPAGYSGAGVLQVTATRMNRDNETVETAPHILKFGDFTDLEQEFSNYSFYVNGVLHGGHAAYGQVFARTPCLGAILYTFVGSQDNNPFDDLHTVFHKSDIQHIEKVLQDLFYKTCDGWYNQPQPIFTIDLSEEYRKKLALDVNKIKESVERLESITIADGKIIFAQLNSLSLPDPINVLQHQIFKHQTYRTVSHGDLHLHNILTSSTGVSWLIDFSHTGFGHILRDLASLDVSIRIALLEDDFATLETRYQLEKMLLQAKEFSDIEGLVPVDNFSPLLQKVFHAVCTLRKIASELVHQNPNSRLHEYYVSLFYYSIRALKYRNLSPLQHLHVLLSAGLIIDGIGV